MGAVDTLWRGMEGREGQPCRRKDHLKVERGRWDCEVVLPNPWVKVLDSKDPVTEGILVVTQVRVSNTRIHLLSCFVSLFHTPLNSSQRNG